MGGESLTKNCLESARFSLSFPLTSFGDPFVVGASVLDKGSRTNEATQGVKSRDLPRPHPLGRKHGRGRGQGLSRSHGPT